MRKFKLAKFRPTVKEVRDFKHFSDSQFRSDLSQVQWDSLLRYDDPIHVGLFGNLSFMKF